MAKLLRITMRSSNFGMYYKNVEKWTTWPEGKELRWKVDPTDQTGVITNDAVKVLFHELNSPVITELDPLLFDLPEECIRSHYGSCWTNDNPMWRMELQLENGQVIELFSESQHAFCLPIRITNHSKNITVSTFNPALSKAIAELLPEGFENRDLISGKSGMLEYDISEFRKAKDEPQADEPPAIDPEVNDADQQVDFEKAEQELFDILWGKESPKEKEKSERTGQISERLMRSISTKDVLDLIERGADINVADEHGQTALMNFADPPFDRNSFRALVAAGANLEARRFDGLTGLMVSCAGGMVDAAREWIEAGANVNAVANDGCTPIMLASRWPRIVEMLLTKGSDVSAVDEDGHNALAYSILHQCAVTPQDEQESLRLLLQAGNDPNQTDIEGKTPVDHARQQLRKVRLWNEPWQPGQEPSGYSRREINHAEALLNLLIEFGGR